MESNKDNKKEKKYRSEVKKRKRRNRSNKKWKQKKYFRRHYYDLYKEFKSIIHNLFCTQCNSSVNEIEWEKKYPVLEKLWNNLPVFDLSLIEKHGIYLYAVTSCPLNQVILELLEIPVVFDMEKKFLIYVKKILIKLNPKTFWSIVSIIRQAKYYYFSICTGGFINKKNNIWNIDLMCKKICSLQSICISYIKRFILIRDVYHYHINNNEILGLENETHGKRYFKQLCGYSHYSYIKLFKKYKYETVHVLYNKIK